VGPQRVRSRSLNEHPRPELQGLLVARGGPLPDLSGSRLFNSQGMDYVGRGRRPQCYCRPDRAQGGVVARRVAFGRVAESGCAIVGTACPDRCRVEGADFGAAPGREGGVLLHAMRMEAVDPEVRMVVAERC
jgi:hypothetical protein